jgi:IclR family pca regulon transcriptional regulator
MADQDLAAGIRSVAAPLRDGDGEVVASMNVTVHAAETSRQTLVEEHLPRLLATTGAISADLARHGAIPHVTAT